jgi:hypothetical protein
MLGIRLPPGRLTSAGQNAQYALPVTRSVRTLVSNSLVGEIESEGELRLGSESLAEFRQRVRVCRGVRIVELQFEIVPRQPWTDDPWRHYSCSRFVWPNESAELVRGVMGTRFSIAEPRFEAPQYVEIEDADLRIAILTNGLPFHRWHDYRNLDSLLQVKNEKQTTFRMGIAIGVRSAAQAAVDFGSPLVMLETATTGRVNQSAAWLLKTDCRNLMVTAIEALADGSYASGIRVRIKETEGRAGRGKFEVARAISRARRVRLDGESSSELNIVDSAVEFGFEAHEFLQIELQW